MTPEQFNAAVNVIADYLRLQTELQAVRSLLITYQNLQRPVPATWEKDLEGMRALPDHSKFLNRFEPELSQALAVADEKSLTALLGKIEQNNLPR